MSTAPLHAAPESLRDIPVSSWMLATRPKTLTASAVPVMVGTALAYASGHGAALPALAALLGALFIQVGTNLVNDFYDFKKGADTDERLGPTRVTQSGLIAPPLVLKAALAFYALAVIIGAYLISVGGWPVLCIGVASVLAGYAYTGGPFPLAYHGLGDVFVFIFFGLVAVCGTYWVQALQLSNAAWLGGVTVGALGTTLIVVNNLRDIPTDVKAGKRTLAVRLGVTGTRAEYVLLVLIALGTPLLMVMTQLARPSVLLCWLTIPLMVPPLKLVLTADGKALNAALGGSARVQLIFGVLLAIGLVV